LLVARVCRNLRFVATVADGAIAVLEADRGSLGDCRLPERGGDAEASSASLVALA